MLITIPAEVTAAEQDVLTAAGWVVNSYRRGGGYTVPLSINLQSLAAAVDRWRKAMHTHSMDSDVNGFDRSAVLEQEGGHSNEQSTSEAVTQRRGCAKASEASDSGRAKAKRKGSVHPGAA